MYGRRDRLLYVQQSLTGSLDDKEAPIQYSVKVEHKPLRNRHSERTEIPLANPIPPSARFPVWVVQPTSDSPLRSLAGHGRQACVGQLISSALDTVLFLMDWLLLVSIDIVT